MDWVKSKGNHVNSQKVLVLFVFKYWNISPVLFEEVKYVKVNDWHKLGSVEKSIARKWNSKQVHVTNLLPYFNCLPERLKCESMKEDKIEE